MLQYDIDSMISLGEQASQYPNFLDHFFYAFGRQLFQREIIADRIDFLIVAVKEDSVLDKTIEVFCPKKNIVVLNDLSCEFGLDEASDGNTAIVATNISEDGDVYSVRSTVRSRISAVIGEDVRINDQMYFNIVDKPGNFWNFTNFNEQIEIFKPAEAFLSPYQTRAAANMIIWASNRLGFKRSPQI